MPIFDYKCEGCGEVQEVIQKFIDEQPRICPKCGAEMKKQVGASSFRLKGDGWFKKTSGLD